MTCNDWRLHLGDELTDATRIPAERPWAFPRAGEHSQDHLVGPDVVASPAWAWL